MSVSQGTKDEMVVAASITHLRRPSPCHLGRVKSCPFPCGMCPRHPRVYRLLCSIERRTLKLAVSAEPLRFLILGVSPLQRASWGRVPWLSGLLMEGRKEEKSWKGQKAGSKA